MTKNSKTKTLRIQSDEMLVVTLLRIPADIRSALDDLCKGPPSMTLNRAAAEVLRRGFEAMRKDRR